MMRLPLIRSLVLALPLLGCAAVAPAEDPLDEPTLPTSPMTLHYLEIVTPDVDATCTALAAHHGVTFGDPDVTLGGARTAALPAGGTVGVRAPMRADEDPIVRPYVLVDDIEAALAEATAAGGVVALPPMELGGHGTCAIYILGGINHGLWQL